MVLQLSVYWWRWSHQMHQSAEAVDIFGAAYFHPVDMIAFTLLGSLVMSLLLGLSAGAIAVAGLVGLFYSLFQHANLRTPQWIGYIIQRPEAYAVHHQRGVHAFNYGDLPIYDLLFGTFRNPTTLQAKAGFYNGASKRMGAMLIGRDVAMPAGAAAAEGTAVTAMAAGRAA